MKKVIKKRVTYDPKDSFQLNLFKDLEYNSLFHLDVLQKGTNNMLISYMESINGKDKA